MDGGVPMSRELDALASVWAGQPSQASWSGARWLAQDEHAPTAVREPGEAVDVHLADSLVALELDARAGGAARSPTSGTAPASRAGARGRPAGGGRQPGREPAAQVRVPASVLCAAAAWRTPASCVRGRRSGAEGLGAHDVVLARALAPQPVVLEYAAPLLRMGGIAGRLARQARRQEAERAASAAGSWACAGRRSARSSHSRARRDHHLHVFEKVAETPARFPRRAGIARKRPLGGELRSA